MNRIWRLTLLIVGIVIVDQLTKGAIQSNFTYGETQAVIDGFFNLTYVKNPGAAFGFMAGASKSVRSILFLVLPTLACFYLIFLIWKSRHESVLQGLMFSLILSGAIGNLIDRYTLGYVVDFFDFYHKSYHFAAFNIADSAISIGAALLIYDTIMDLKRKSSGDKQEAGS